jgi:DNA polymerase-3 subunit delta
VILVADDETGDDNKQARLKTLKKNWAKAVKAADGEAFSFDPDPRAIREELKKALAKSGKTMSEAAATALIEMTGGSYSRALEELQKLELFIGDQPQIRESDVRDVVMPSREWNVYKMVDSVFIGQMPEALTQLRVLMGSQTKAEDAAFSRILPTISRHLRLLWQARACVEAKCSNPGFAPESLARTFPEKNSIAKEQPYRVGPLMNTASRLKFAQIERCFAIVADTDARLKGSLSAFSALDTLERMLLEMSAVVAPQR